MHAADDYTCAKQNISGVTNTEAIFTNKKVETNNNGF